MVNLATRSTSDLFGDPIGSRPEWYRQDVFAQPEFDYRSYISDLRTFVPFDALRSELQAHSTSLNHELIELVNRNYGDFVSLSTQLVDFDGIVVRMRAPVTEFREKIATLKSSLETSLAALRSGLQRNTDASDIRESLERLLDTSHVVLKVEKLIKELSSVSEHWSDAKSAVTSNGFATSGGIAEVGTSLRDTQSMLLERISSEMNRLKFYIAHSQNLPFMESMVKRMRSVTITLDRSLGRCFSDAVEHRNPNVVRNCLRAYAATDNTRDAEEHFRKMVVRPIVGVVILSGVSIPTDVLEDDYRKLKKLIDEDCKFLLDITFAENSGLHAFSFLANSILREVLSALQTARPDAFSPGRPLNFLNNYMSSLDFLSHLEGYCSSTSDVDRFRAEPVYSDFMKLWNLGAYVSLRFQEIAGVLDSALKERCLEVASDRAPQGPVLSQSVVLLETLRLCWREDVFVYSCSDKFLRLSLQLISRFAGWLDCGLSGDASGALLTRVEDFIRVIHDIRVLCGEIRGRYADHVMDRMSSSSREEGAMSALHRVRESLVSADRSLGDVEPRMIDALVNSLVEKAAEDLRQVKGITATYRMTNKPLPVRHSPYVSLIARPLKLLMEEEEEDRLLPSETRVELLTRTATAITSRFNDLASDLVTVAKRTESSLMRIRQGAQRRAGGGSQVSDHNVSDTDKICMQLFLDVQEYGRCLSAFGVDARDIPSYCSLWHCVAPPDTHTVVSF